jgi:hypothetical protein
MAADLDTALKLVDMAAMEIMEATPTVRSVGVGIVQGGYGFVAIRNVNAPTPLRTGAMPHAIEGIPVEVLDAYAYPATLATVPATGPGSPGIGSLIPEQLQSTELVCGLQIQNYLHDSRSGALKKGYINVGSIGCFVQPQGDGPFAWRSNTALLTNNHVIAGDNLALHGDDILQPGSLHTAAPVGMLTKFVALRPSPPGVRAGDSRIILNNSDAAIAEVASGFRFRPGYLPQRRVPPPTGSAAALPGDVVVKVGRTSGLTFGVVTLIGAVIGPVTYDVGECWFRGCLVIEGRGGSTFSDCGDSGSGIVRDDGNIVGLLFAGTSTQTYACSIDSVLGDLGVTLVA